MEWFKKYEMIIVPILLGFMVFVIPFLAIEHHYLKYEVWYQEHHGKILELHYNNLCVRPNGTLVLDNK